jgi:hypothetical protein
MPVLSVRCGLVRVQCQFSLTGCVQRWVNGCHCIRCTRGFEQAADIGPRAPLQTLHRTLGQRPMLPQPASDECFSVTSPPFLASGVMENKCFISTKVSNPAELARGTPNPSLPLKLHYICKCANTTMCISPCVCVLAFSQSFFKVLR